MKFNISEKEVSLQKNRAEINDLDTQIIDLLAKRMSVVTKIGHLKQASGQVTLDINRENQVLGRVARKSPKPEYTPYLLAIYQDIMANSRQYQNDLKSQKLRFSSDIEANDLR